MSPCHPNTSECSFCDGFVYHYRAPAAAGAASTRSVTTASGVLASARACGRPRLPGKRHASCPHNVRLADMNIDVPVGDAGCIVRSSQTACPSGRQTYPELASARRARLVVIGVEVGGGCGAEAAAFLRHLARHRAASLRPLLRAAACAGWVQRWSSPLAVAAMRAFAASLLELPPGGDLCDAGESPNLHEVFAEVRGVPPLVASRLPAP